MVLIHFWACGKKCKVVISVSSSEASLLEGVFPPYEDNLRR